MEEFEYYLTCDIEELKKPEAKYALILNRSKNQLIWFCQRASKERIEALFDEAGISLFLDNAKITKDRINGSIINGFVDNDLLKNQELCELIHGTKGSDFSSLRSTNAVDYFKFLQREHPKAIYGVFSYLSDESQKSVLQEIEFGQDAIYNLLYACKPESAQYLIDTDTRLNLDNASYNFFESLSSKRVTMPPRLMTKKVINNISTMDDVNAYRFLVTGLSDDNDTEEIENARKKYYEKELSSIGEDGLLPEYHEIKERVLDGNDSSVLDDYLGTFHRNHNTYEEIDESSNIDKTIQKLSDYKMSNMIIDYFFEEIPTNVLEDIKSMVEFQNKITTLDPASYNMYVLLANIDRLSPKEKLNLFNSLKGKDLMSKFYDDFSRTKEKMVEEINESILNEKNLEPYYNEQLSHDKGVPVYSLHGQPFKALIRSWGKTKEELLQRDNVEFHTDASSFSIDSSTLLSPYQDPRETYTIAYDKIPAKNLIHLFPTDSYTNYRRNQESRNSR